MASLGDDVDGLVEASRSIFDLIRDTALESETARRLAPAAIEALARADGSAGWCLSIGAVSGALAGGFLEDDAIAEIFADPGVIIAGAVAPRAQAVPVEGGYRVTGRWNFGSGCQHSAWLLGGSLVMRETGPEWRIVFFPRDQAVIHDNWNVAGLKGTGSCDYSVDDLFVADSFTLNPVTTPAKRGGTLYKMPFSAFAAASHAGFALGVAQRALDEIRQFAVSQPPRSGSSTRLADRPAFQQALARSDAALRAARLFVVDALGRLWAAASDDQEMTVELRASLRLAVNHATDVAAEGATMAYRFGGGGALYDSHILQRCFRDIHAATQHAFVSEEMYERYAQSTLGNLPENTMF